MTVVITVMAVVASFPLFFQLAAPLLRLPAMVAMLPLGVPQIIFGFVDAFLAFVVTIDCLNPQWAPQEQ